MEFLVAALFVSQIIIFIFIHILFKRQEESLLQLIEFNSWRTRFREILVMILKEHKKRTDKVIEDLAEFKTDTVEVISKIGDKVFPKRKSTEKNPAKKAKK